MGTLHYWLYVILLFIFLGIPEEAISQQAAPPGFQFIPNKTQWNQQVLFRVDIPSGKLYLKNNGFSYLFYDAKALKDKHDHATPAPAHRKLSASQDLINMHALDVEFVGANQEVLVRGGKEGDVGYNYFLGNDATTWSTGIHGADDVLYENIYPFTNLKVYATKEGIKYDFIVRPGAQPKDIKLRYHGADKLVLEGGNLIAVTSLQRLSEQEPYAYQVRGKDTLRVACEFHLKDNDVQFHFPEGYDTKQELVIDPLLIFSSYSGSTADNWGFSATYDDEGNLYASGIVFDPGFPTTVGAFQRSFSGNVDIGILKFDSTGSRLLYASYLGGSMAESPHSLVVNNRGELVILGSTGSADFPTSESAFQRDFKGGASISPILGISYASGSDLIISKLSVTGDALLASTLIGGQKNDGMMEQFRPLTKNYGDQFRGELITDADNNVFVASHTTSEDFPIKNAFQPVYGGGESDGVIFKFNEDLTELVFSSFLGGASDDAAYSVKLTTEGEAIVGGGTLSPDFPMAVGSAGATLSGDIDGFIVKVEKDGASLINSTFVGTAAYDQVYLLDVNANGNIYAMGQTLGDFPVSEDIYHVEGAGQFIQKFSTDLSEVLFSTVFGSGNNVIDFSPTAFLVNDCENMFVAGWGGFINSEFNNGFMTGYVGGSTLGLPVTADAYQATTDGSDFYLMVLAKDAEELLYGTFFGGNGTNEHVDGGTSRFDKRGIVYQAVCGGCGGSSGFPTTPGAWSTINRSSNCNNAAFKFDLTTLKADFDTNTPSFDQPGINAGCYPFTVVFLNKSIGGKSFEWDFGDGTTSDKKDSIIHTYKDPGVYQVILKAVDINTCIREDFAYGTITVFTPEFFVGEDVMICGGEATQLSSSGGESYNWSPAEGLSNTTIANPMANPSQTTTYNIDIVDINGCTFSDSVLVEVIPEVRSDFLTEFVDNCDSKPTIQFTYMGLGAKEFQWNFGDGTSSSEESPLHAYDNAGTYQVSLVASNAFCTNTKVISLPLKEFRIPNIITPNGDQKNDVFEIVSNVKVQLAIYNRWGKEVYRNKDYKNTWAGEKTASGIYFYEVTLPDRSYCKGWVQLVK